MYRIVCQLRASRTSKTTLSTLPRMRQWVSPYVTRILMGWVILLVAFHPMPLSATQDHVYEEVLDGSGMSVVELVDGKIICRPAAPLEMASMIVDADEPLYALSSSDAVQGQQQQTGFQLNLRVTDQLRNNTEVLALFERAAQMWEALITAPLTVTIEADFGETRFGVPFPNPNILGSASARVIGPFNYPEVRSMLIEGASAEERPLLASLPMGNVPTDRGALNQMVIAITNARAIGVAGDAEATRFVPNIGFNSAFNWDLTPDNGIDADRLDFLGTASHELGHILGFISQVDRQPTPPNMAPWDLFRFQPGTTTATFGTAPRIMTETGDQVFFAGGQDLRLSTGAGGDGQQASHWKDEVQNFVSTSASWILPDQQVFWMCYCPMTCAPSMRWAIR